MAKEVQKIKTPKTVAKNKCAGNPSGHSAVKADGVAVKWSPSIELGVDKQDGLRAINRVSFELYICEHCGCLFADDVEHDKETIEEAV